MAFFRKITNSLRRGFNGLVDANLRYTRTVHGTRAVADGRHRRRENARGGESGTSRRAA